jgi:ABC-2 type transport system permease protein
LLGGCVWITWSLLSDPKFDLLTPRWFLDILGRLQFSEQRLLPSWWLSEGLLDAATREWSESVLFLTLLISNAMFFRQLALWTAGWIYRASYDGLYSQSVRRKRLRPAQYHPDIGESRGSVPGPLQLLLAKDLRLFRRDPLQWSQLLVFLGLLGLYFLNIRSFTYTVPYVGWVNMISFLNLAVVGLLLSTFTTRFIYPMISLEGRRFWILGLLPVPRDTLLWSKFLFATVGSVVPCSLLVLLSDVMLDVSSLVLLSHQVTSLVLCLGLSGLAVGLGARLPNMREQSPARIAAGFGGTLTLVLSTLYILAVVALTALPTHSYLAARYAGVGTSTTQQSNVSWWLQLWLATGIAGSILLGAIATLVPMYIGLRSLRRMEF